MQSHHVDDVMRIGSELRASAASASAEGIATDGILTIGVSVP